MHYLLVDSHHQQVFIWHISSHYALHTGVNTGTSQIEVDNLGFFGLIHLEFLKALLVV